jgi:hypothetical protein
VDSPIVSPGTLKLRPRISMHFMKVLAELREKPNLKQVSSVASVDSEQTDEIMTTNTSLTTAISLLTTLL